MGSKTGLSGINEKTGAAPSVREPEREDRRVKGQKTKTQIGHESDPPGLGFIRKPVQAAQLAATDLIPQVPEQKKKTDIKTQRENLNPPAYNPSSGASGAAFDWQSRWMVRLPITNNKQNHKNPR